jgi:hypothetical protein
MFPPVGPRYPTFLKLLGEKDIEEVLEGRYLIL